MEGMISLKELSTFCMVNDLQVVPWMILANAYTQKVFYFTVPSIIGYGR